MPQQVTIGDQVVTVYTEEELRAAQEAARQGLVPVSERDSAAAAARREAEQALVQARAELATAQAGSQRAQELEQQVQALTGERDGALRTLQGVEVLAGAGLNPAQARILLGSPLFQNVDLANEEARNQAIEQTRATFPGLFAAPGGGEGGQGQGGSGGAGGGAGGGFNGAGGSPAPGRQEPDVAAIEKMSQAEYEAWRQKG